MVVPQIVVAKRPLKDGVIADYRTTEAMLRYFINKAMGAFAFFVQRLWWRCLRNHLNRTSRRDRRHPFGGSKAAYIIKEPVVAAIGANIPIGSASGHMIIDIGGGTSEIAVISLGGIVSSASVRIGGNKLDGAIQEHVRRKYSLAVGERNSKILKYVLAQPSI